jgi:hypothetical protein
VQRLVTPTLLRSLISVFEIFQLDTMANSVQNSQASIFPFLLLPAELRLMIYVYALFTPHGI